MSQLTQGSQTVESRTFHRQCRQMTHISDRMVHGINRRLELSFKGIVSLAASRHTMGGGVHAA